ncbi:MAG: SH3 domain-containing protein [Caldiserica bacterium]|jgi:uncharacterized protein YgiM (DUF1202 family)|nr:SH3 domain-containing protein [Caldisericota bacterium]MDH7562749.1 SH3 domain-containing protein [Caldisericota bacterium]
MSIGTMVGSILEIFFRKQKGSRLFFFLIFLSFIFLICSCGKSPTFVSVIGVVYDSKTNQVLADVTVRSGPEKSTSTSQRGVFELSNLTPGKIQLSFEKEGYRPAAREFELNEGKEFLEVLMEPLETVAYTLADQVKLRSQPSVSGEIIDALSLNARVVLQGNQEKGWYQVQVNGKTGWVWGGYLKSEDVSIPRMEVKKDSTLFSSPDEGSEGVQEVYEGYQVIVTQQQGDWAKVLLPSGAEGWMRLEVLSP